MYLNETSITKIQYNVNIIEENYLDALRVDAKASTRALQAQKVGIYYTMKNGKLFLFFDKNSYSILDSIKNNIKSFLNKIWRYILLDPVKKEEIEKLKKISEIKKGADFSDVKRVIDYYEEKTKLDSIKYNKMCNTWSYLVLPLVKGPATEKLIRKNLDKVVGKVFPEDVLKHPEILKQMEIDCKNKKKIQ